MTRCHYQKPLRELGGYGSVSVHKSVSLAITWLCYLKFHPCLVKEGKGYSRLHGKHLWTGPEPQAARWTLVAGLLRMVNDVEQRT